jgi:CYTH domain-containing protein
MAYKPTDIYLGVVDVFVILLPGAVAVALGTPLILGKPPAFPELTASNWAPWTALAYLSGHLISSLGSRTEDWWNCTQIGKRRIAKDRKKHRRQSEAASEVIRKLANIHDSGNLRRIAQKVLLLQGGEAATHIARKDADRRLFRNLSIVLMLVWIASVVSEIVRIFNHTVPSTIAEIIAVTIVMAWCIIRYFDQDSKYSRDVYEYLVLNNATTASEKGKQHDTEIERRFLVRSDAWLSLSVDSEHILQGYLSAERECTLRVRTSGRDRDHAESAWLGLKGPGGSGSFTRYEGEWSVPLPLANYIFANLCRGYRIAKTRYSVPAKECSLTWTVDVFEAENEGLVLAEIELKSEDQHVRIPDWIGEEITSDGRYSNAELSKHAYRDWKDTRA